MSVHRPGLVLRGYQSRIVNMVLRESTIVLLPTGAGKTPIAAVAIAETLKLNPSTKAVLFVPTIALVGQQAKVMRHWAVPSCKVGEFHGETSLPIDFDVLVTTPKAFESSQLSGHSLCAWHIFSIVIFDEVHHAIKDHPYRTLAQRLLRSNHTPRVVGMTASLTYAVGADKVRAASQKLCDQLRISRIEVATDEELRSGGYNGAAAGTVAELHPRKRKFEDTRDGLDFEGGHVIPMADRKPHLMHSSFFGRILKGTATSTSQQMVQCVRAVEKDALAVNSTFKSPLVSASLASWGAYAHKQRLLTAMPLYAALESWYEACRILVTSWEEGEDLSVQFLRLMDVESEAAVSPHPFYSAATRKLIDGFFAHRPSSYERFDNLLLVLQDKIRQASGEFCGIIFVRQRVTAHVLEHFLLSSSLSSSMSIRPAILYSSTSPATPSLKLSSSQGAAALAAFKDGTCNLLVATSVAEEGVDVPEANCVIYFDAIDTAVSYVQGRGRARQKDSSFVMMSERPDRPAAVLAEMELEQHAIASTFQPNKNGAATDAAQRVAQKSRETTAMSVLADAAGGKEETAVGALNLYCKKTKALFTESYQCNDGGWICTVSYESILRSVSISNEKDKSSKKLSKKRASYLLLEKLLILTRT
jgi:ERCC4-related helicase